MQKFKLYPVINGTTDFKSLSSFIKKTVIYNSLENGLPFGYMDIIDPESRTLTQFENLQVGSQLDLKVAYDEGSVGSNVEKLNIEDWVLLRTQAINDSPGKDSTLRIIFGHKMFLYKDQTNHCFEAQSNDKIIKRVLEDKTRGCDFKLVHADIPDNEPIKRYKVLESDWEFLKNKVVAFSSYKKTPMYLYADLNSNFYFDSIATMFSKNPQMVLYYSPDNEESSEAYKEFTNVYATTETDIPMSFKMDIGNKNAVSEMNKQFIIFDNQTGMTFSGIKGPSSKIENDNTALSKYYPIDYAFAALTSSGSSISTLNNHNLNDAYNLLNNSLKDFDRMFTLSIKTRFSAALLDIGNCIALFFSKGHWANGKWILLSNKIVLDEGGNAQIDLVLGRPTFSGSKSKTTLTNYGSLFHR